MPEVHQVSGDTPAPTGQGLRAAMAEQVDHGAGEGQFQAAADGQLRCLTCRRTSDASEQAFEDVRRIEGASDPADMALVTPVRCPHCGTSGILVVRYGPEASEEEADLLVRLPRHGHGSTESESHGFQPAEPGTLAEQRPLVDAEGDDIREYTGEPVETEAGWVLPQQQNVGPGNEATGGATEDDDVPQPPRDDEQLDVGPDRR